MEEITTIDFIEMFAIGVLTVIIFMLCAAGIIIAATCIYKATEKIVKTIENFFDNL